MNAKHERKAPVGFFISANTVFIKKTESSPVLTNTQLIVWEDPCSSHFLLMID